MLLEYYSKVKKFLQENRNDLYTAVIIFLVGISSFGLGRLSVLWPKKEPIEFINNQLSVTNETKQSLGRETGGAAIISSTKGKYAASKSGTAYHYPWCPGAQKIKEENKIWFQTKEEAESKGYKPARNCEGL